MSAILKKLQTFNSDQQVYGDLVFTVRFGLLHQVIERELFVDGFLFCFLVDKVEFILILLQTFILLFGLGKKHVPDASGVGEANFRWSTEESEIDHDFRLEARTGNKKGTLRERKQYVQEKKTY
ncbi:hypothetical protein BC938DRAFT_483116 [Jimgerdemannia flammicorona]|uniref:Uncharacterized protein n=1 Tax=Jimgerdemannia flammicorona TaxID=994334 RepID=A0A433QW69_9FUNG|nr:hypothetical protein BC938DRAFT_483116 [Jimgerdemannia flammicorona]